MAKPDPSLLVAPNGNRIVSELSCERCAKERPPLVNAREWDWLVVGATAAGGFQVWCMRHRKNVVHVPLEQLVSFFSQMGARRGDVVLTDS